MVMKNLISSLLFQKNLQVTKILQRQYHSIKIFRKGTVNEQTSSGTKQGSPRRWWVGIAAITAGSVGIGAYVFKLNGTEYSSAWPLKIGICEGEVIRKEISENSEDNRRNETFIKNVKLTLPETINKARDIVTRVKDEVGTPGIIIGVSVDGEVVWKEGFGYSNVENRVPCTPDTVMRIASISKPLTMTAVAKLWEEGKLDVDKPVQEYIPSFPEKNFNGDKVIITPRLLASHLSGIRHYEKSLPQNKTNKNETTDSTGIKPDVNNNKKKGNVRTDSAYWEMYIKDKYQNVQDSLKLFKDDPLLYKPGSHYLYTTYGFVLLSAVAEAAAKRPFTDIMKELFSALGLKTTYLDEHEPLIYNRSSYYEKKNNKLVNAPYVDNSYKWGGGGFLSTVGDLLQFGNAMLYSFQLKPDLIVKTNNTEETLSPKNSLVKSCKDNDSLETHSLKETLPGFLKHETMKKLWTPVVRIHTPQNAKASDVSYGMGWTILPAQHICKFCDDRNLYVSHSGGAIGASSILLIMPKTTQTSLPHPSLPHGIVVSIITNLTDVHLSSTAIQIAQLFETADL